MITLKELVTSNVSDLKAKDMITDVALINSLEVKQSKTGSDYGSGVLRDSDGHSVSYMIWDVTIIKLVQEVLDNEGLPLLTVIGEVNIFNGKASMILKQIKNAPVGVDTMAFLESKYTGADSKDIFSKMLSVYTPIISDDAKDIINTIMHQDDTAQRFTTEFAAIYHHDNALHGLLAHTSKMIQIAGTVVSQQNNLVQTQQEKDLLFVGLLFHDLGKIRTYTMGRATSLAFVDHQFLGVELIEKQKDKIIETYSENWYYQLVAILLQHHGVYGARPQTTMAYLVHLIDMFEAQVTSLDSAIADANPDTRISIFAEDEKFKLERLK